MSSHPVARSASSRPFMSQVLSPEVKRAFIGRLERAFAQIVGNELVNTGPSVDTREPHRQPQTNTRRAR